MKTKTIIIILAIAIGSKFILDLLFKIKYNEKEIYFIENLVLNESDTVKDGTIVIGKNIKGSIEAIIFPKSNLILSDNSLVEYIYFRFYPEWFETHIKPNLTDGVPSNSEALVTRAKALHDINFKSYMHLNNYPLVKNDFVPYVYHIADSDRIIRMEFKLND